MRAEITGAGLPDRGGAIGRIAGIGPAVGAQEPVGRHRRPIYVKRAAKRDTVPTRSIGARVFVRGGVNTEIGKLIPACS
jgi:hypothetical protein